MKLLFLKVFWVCFLFVMGGENLYAQFSSSDGLPFIRNYSPEEYNWHIQSWGFAQDSNGVLYVSNLAGVIRYDGENWQQIEILNARSYSIKSDAKGKIYIGGANEFGYLDNSEKDSLTGPQYYSLRSHIPDSVTFGQIWDIEYAEDAIYFRSNTHVFRYNGKEVTVYNTKTRFPGLYKVQDEIYLRESLVGMHQFIDGELVPDNSGDFFMDKALKSTISINGKVLYCSNQKCYQVRGDSITDFDTEADEYLAKNSIDEVMALSDGTILFATRTGGIVNVAANGKLIHIINEKNGLINNTVYGLYEDDNGSVWAATVNGVSRIDYNVPLRFFGNDYGITESVNKVQVYRSQLMFSSVSGMYSWLPGNYLPQKIETGASCSEMIQIKERLYVSCGGSLYLKEGTGLKIIENVLSVREMVAYSDQEYFFYGNDRGYYLVNLDNDKAEVLYEIDDIGINPSSIYVDSHQNIWIGTDTHGVIKLNIYREGNSFRHHTETLLSDVQSISTNKRIHVTELNETPAFLTWGKGIQRYNYESRQMQLETTFGELFSDTTRQYFLAEEDLQGNIWFRSGEEYQSALLQEDGSYSTYEGVLKLIHHRQSSDIFPDNFGYVWYATDQGLVRFDKSHTFDHTKTFHTQINEVFVRNDSLLNGGNGNNHNILNYRDNELRFRFAATSYLESEKTQYRVKLEGFDTNWSPWSNEFQKDYTNIPEGNYNFTVQAKNTFGVVSSSAPFQFSVLPPWYRTWWAYLLYTITLVALFYSAYRVRLNQILKVYRIRNSIASDLHDEVSATLSSISYFAQAIKSDAIKGDKNRFVTLISDSAGDAKEKISDIVWAINPEHDEWRGFLSKCRRYASDLLESKEMKYSLKITEDIPGELDMQLRQHLWLIYKEMVTNSVRHSDAKQLDVIINHKKGKLNIVVQDNGKGMDVDKVKKGNGLVNINKRVDQINGDITLTSDASFGTRWVLKLEL
ncbi:MAG: two-component regulator propeller domain-containing protein [Balneolaceae bacterium]